jgi:hypothetical protein
MSYEQFTQYDVELEVPEEAVQWGVGDVIPGCSLGRPSINSRQHYVDLQSYNLA